MHREPLDTLADGRQRETPFIWNSGVVHHDHRRQDDALMQHAVMPQVVRQTQWDARTCSCEYRRRPR